MRRALVILGVVVGPVLVVLVVGALLPRDHVATSAVTMRQPPEVVWPVIRDQGALPSWWPEITGSERLADRDGREVWRQTMRSGFEMVVVVTEVDEPTRLVTHIDSPPGAPFGGDWIYRLSPADGGTRVSVTERGWIANPVFRFLARVVFSYHDTLDGYLEALGRHFGEELRAEHTAAE